MRTDPQWLSAHWMPFSGNRQFKQQPRLFTAAEGVWYTTAEGKQVFDGLSGLWCAGLGHAVPAISRSLSQQAQQLDYSPAFQFAHPLSFALANRIVEKLPRPLDHVLFTASGSEAADTSLKLARAYWNLKGQGQKTRLIGRIKGYHGVNFGGIAVGGIVANRKLFGPGIETDHLPHIQPPAGSFFRGMPPPAAHLAAELENLIALHDASTIAAVIVEPMAGSAGVLVPPVGYLQQLREICTRHNILLIFDEVITGFGRCGAWSGAEAFGVVPDMFNFAKQITNGVQPLGGVVVKHEIYQAFMDADLPPYLIELPHGYTYSAHPVACAAALACLEVLEQENALERVRQLAPKFEAKVHSLRGAQHVLDIRNYGLAAALTLEAWPKEPAKRPFEVAMKMFDKGFYVRYGGDTLQLAPPFISTEAQLDNLISALGEALQEVD